MNRDGYENTVLALKDRVHSYATYVLGNAEEGAEVAQEALVRLWQHRERVPAEGGAARAWLLRTAHNLCMDRLRLRKSRPQVDPEHLGVLPDAEHRSPERGARGREIATGINQALKQLSPRDRAVIVMREVQGMSYDEISAALELPLGTLKAALHRARDRLRTRLVEAGIRP